MLEDKDTVDIPQWLEALWPDLVSSPGCSFARPIGFIQHICVWGGDAGSTITTHSLEPIFLQELLPFSKFSLIRLVPVLCLELTAVFLSHTPHWQWSSAYIILWWFTLPISAEKCLCFRHQSSCSGGGLPGIELWPSHLSTHQCSDLGNFFSLSLFPFPHQ